MQMGIRVVGLNYVKQHALMASTKVIRRRKGILSPSALNATSPARLAMVGGQTGV